MILDEFLRQHPNRELLTVLGLCASAATSDEWSIDKAHDMQVWPWEQVERREDGTTLAAEFPPWMRAVPDRIKEQWSSLSVEARLCVMAVAGVNAQIRQEHQCL